MIGLLIFIFTNVIFYNVFFLQQFTLKKVLPGNDNFVKTI